MDTPPSNAQPETSPSRSPDASDSPTTEKVTSSPDSAPKPKRKRRLRIWVAAIAGVLLVVFGVPWIQHSLNTVSTDDAYVNSYVTFVAPRVAGQVLRVLVDDNDRVNKGDVLVELDPEPFQVQVEIRQAAVDTAQANLVLAQATVRSLLGQARSQRFKLTRAIEDVDNQIALIRARVATLEQSKATLALAQAELKPSRCSAKCGRR
jgi:membrane fusion protein (multidrug efflux system)